MNLRGFWRKLWGPKFDEFCTQNSKFSQNSTWNPDLSKNSSPKQQKIARLRNSTLTSKNNNTICHLSETCSSTCLLSSFASLLKDPKILFWFAHNNIIFWFCSGLLMMYSSWFTDLFTQFHCCSYLYGCWEKAPRLVSKTLSTEPNFAPGFLLFSIPPTSSFPHSLCFVLSNRPWEDKFICKVFWYNLVWITEFRIFWMTPAKEETQTS